FRGVKETLPAILVVSITYTLTQGLLTVFSGPELADIIPPLLTMLALAVFSKKFQPKHIYRVNKDEEIEMRDLEDDDFVDSKINIAKAPMPEAEITE
ncbi:L-lactate permease, partial [Enterococcus faecalis]|uniref:L-lactate permease n=1 Tax=Enterococcus faecalis TaxID=1351 RepID=UPI0024537BD2